MSVLLDLIAASSTPGGVTVAADGLLDWVNVKAGEFTTTVKIVAAAVCTAFVLYKTIVARGALATVIGAALTAALAYFFIKNVMFVEQKVDNEISTTAAHAVVRIVDLPADPYEIAAPLPAGHR